MNAMGLLEIFKTSEAEIIQNKKDGVIYIADFPNGTGKYVSIAEASISADLDVRISSRIHLRVTYLTNDEKINGVEISKVDGNKVEKIHFSTLDFERILQLLNLFSELDLKAVTNKTVVFDESIIGDSKEVSKFLTLIVSDPQGKDRIREIAKNYGLIKLGDIDSVVHKKEVVELFDKILNNESEFNKYKKEINVGKDEEVWQRFFSENSWILGSDFVDILDERRIDVENITDYLLKSFDGFVDIVELKLPTAPFWTTEFIPKSELTSATMQCNRYILQTERKINDLEFNKKIQNTPIVKPRITLIYGRSQSWGEKEKEAYRVLNSSYTNVNIVTYDHLIERARRLIGMVKKSNINVEELNSENIPF
ncbi:MAG: Shedu anti-phage system protein SduA domain-containing protein [archaeon]